MCYWTEGLCLCVRKDKFEPFTSDGQKQGPDQQERDCKFTCINSFVANAHSITGLPQKKGLIPNYCHNYTEIKYVKDISCVGHLSSINRVTNVPTVAIDLPVGARLHQFWKKNGKP